MSQILQLTPAHFIAKGSHKQCLRHPQNERLCIKIPYNKAGEVDLNREIFYLTHILKNRGPQSGILPRYYGPVQTNLGTGHVFDLICDTDGRVSESIEQVLKKEPDNSALLPGIRQQLLELRDKMLAYRVICMSIYPENILYQKLDGGQFRLMLINDMGSSSTLPLEYILPPLTNIKIKRYWNRFIQTSLPHRLPPAAAKYLADVAF